MSFKVFNTIDVVPEKDVYLKLEQNEFKGVDLVAVDEKGNVVSSPNILQITSQGELELYNSCSKTLGLHLDVNNKIVVTR